VTKEPDDQATEVRNPHLWATGAPAIVSSVRVALREMGPRRAVKALAMINQPGGFDCPSCAWPELPPGERHRIEFCESGAKAVADEATKARVGPEFFAAHSLKDLATRSDFWLGQAGRLTSPMIKRKDATHYEPISWKLALRTIAGHLRALDSPNQAVFYTSGRTSNEAAFLYQLMVRCFGTNNLPDCSNMCHEPTSTALKHSIGIGKGSVRLSDFTKADLILIAGQNPGTNAPRMLTTLEDAKRAGAKIIAINPLPEAGLLRFKNPQRLNGIVGSGTELADIHLPIRLNGDQALFQLFSRWLVQRSRTNPAVLDHRFIQDHTSGFGELCAHLDSLDDHVLVQSTGLDEQQLRAAFELIAGAQRMIVCWAMGITQHVNAVDTIHEISNLALLGGHIGRPGAGLCPIRGHSNVQGDRTMGIFEQPDPSLLDALTKEFEVAMPSKDGFDTVDAVRAFVSGAARVFVGLGGNFARATPDTNVTEPALQNAQMTVQISTKLNRSHVMCGETAIILPTLGRTDCDIVDGVAQYVTVEDSMGLVHASRGVLEAPSPRLRSEVSIIGALAHELFGARHVVPWRELSADNDVIRERIARVIPGFENFNERVGGGSSFELPHPPRDERRFPTPDGTARFSVTHHSPVTVEPGVFTLQTLRSHDQFNTTIYGHKDRYRGISGDRHVLMINADDIASLGFADGDLVDLVAVAAGPERRAAGYRLVAYPTPRGSVAAYYPETNVLLALDHHGTTVQTPAAKSIRIRIEAATAVEAQTG
jgi:molybdopterin-dependent oxidoreductase alpha subunit